MTTLPEILTIISLPALATMSASQVIAHIRRSQTGASAREAIAAADRVLAAKGVRS
jgi:hypothetical protein